jgi:menaquinone-dependent protoporphyrinogen oxidase
MKWLVVFATNQDQSAKVAQRIAHDLSSFGDDADLFNAAAAPLALSMTGYDAVIVGVSARSGHAHRSVRRFVEEHIVELGCMPSAFCRVLQTEEGSDPASRPRPLPALDTLLEETGWQPDLVAVLAAPIPRTPASGRLAQRELGRGRQPADVASEQAGYQYVDWKPVTTFARDCAMHARHVRLVGAVRHSRPVPQ